MKQAGFDVGEVSNISLETIKEPTSSIFICVEILVSEEAIISNESEASIQTLGMMGEKYIEISFGTKKEAPEGTRIEGQGPFELDRVMEKAVSLTDDLKLTVQSFNKIIGDPELQTNMTKLIANLEQFSEDLNTILGGEQDNFKIIIENMVAASDNLNSTIATAELFITDTRKLISKNEGNISTTLENVSVVSQEIRENLVMDIKTMSKELKQFSVKLNDSIEQANGLMAKIDGMVDENKPNVQQIMDNVTNLSKKANNASERVDDILKHIQKENGLVHSLIYDPEMAESTKKTLNNASGFLEGASSFTERFEFMADLRYFPDSPRFDPDDNNMRADLGIKYNFDNDFFLFAGGNSLGSANDVEAQLGYWFGPVAVHGGLIESEVGVGIDWQVIDRLLLGVEGVGLTDRHEERLDTYAEVLLWEWLSLVGGVQDITDEQFANVGLRVHF